MFGKGTRNMSLLMEAACADHVFACPVCGAETANYAVHAEHMASHRRYGEL